MLGRCLLPFLVPFIALCQAAAADLDDAIAKLRSDFFNEVSLGSPGLTEAEIDEDFVRRIYKVDDAAKAMARIFAEPDYAEINKKIGKLRNRINLEIWGTVVSDFAIGLELNNAGKMNGAISDLDQTLYTDAEVVVDRDGTVRAEGSQAVHQFLIEEFSRRFGKRMDIAQTQAAVGEVYDMMHFTGDGMMADWRMSDSRWQEFRMGMDASVEGLSRTDGAYWFPGAYKTQVFTRYLNEGKTIRVEPTTQQGGAPDITGYDQVKVPDGVQVRYGNTRKLSKLYADVPITVDRTGALGSLYENRYHASHQDNPLKIAKYTNREVDTALVHATNLEVDFRHLVLEGRDRQRRYFVQRTFDEFRDQLPPELADVEEIQRIMEINQRIELDKVIRNTPERPASWAAEWQNYEPRNINDVETKLLYYDQEVATMEEILSGLQGGGPDMNDPEVRARVAAAAEDLFRRKSRAVTRLGAVKLGRKLLRDVFSRQGYARTRHLMAADPTFRGQNTRQAMQRLLAERVADLHVAMVFIDDPRLIQDVIDQAPEESRGALTRLRDIAHAQRADIINRQGVVDAIEQGHLIQGDVVLRELLMKLDVPAGEQAEILKSRNIPNVPGQTRIASFAEPEWYRRTMLMRMHEAMIERYRDGQRITSDTVSKSMAGRAQNYVAETYVFNLRNAQEFYLKTLPAIFELKPTMEMGYFGREYINSFLNVGTVDSGAKIAAAYAMGNQEAVRQEIRDAIIGGIWLGGDIYGFVKNLKDWDTTGNATPLATQIITKGLGYAPGGAPYAALMGHVLVYYSMANTLYQVGWHFYGQPTQTEVVSLVLTGQRGVVPIAAGSSVLRPFKDPRTMEFLRKNALLDLHVKVPEDLPQKWRESILKQFFLASANRSALGAMTAEELRVHNIIAADLSSPMPAAGAYSGWHDARNRVMNSYYRNWRYWFQRLWFYHIVSKDFYQRMDGMSTGGKDWMRIDDEPPVIISAQSEGEWAMSFGSDRGWILEYFRERGLKSHFADAYTRRPDGTGYWDHEQVYLRLYFERWIREWEKRWEDAQMEHGEFLYEADVAAGDWRKAVVDELIRYYLEGEAFYRANPQHIDEMDGLAEAQKEAARAHALALQGLDVRVVDKIRAEAEKKAAERLRLFEELQWSPSVVGNLQKTMESAAAKKPAYKPDPTELTVHVPRPVGRVGQKIPIQILVRGDTGKLADPNDYQIKVNYRKLSETVGSRPPEILRDDVAILLGEDVTDENLHWAKYESTVEVTSREKPGATLTETFPVYWIAAKDAEDGDDDGAEGDSESEMDGFSDELLALARRAESEAASAAEPCATARELLRRGASKIAKVTAEIGQIRGALGGLTETAKGLEESLKTAQTQDKEVYALAEKLGELRVKLGEEAKATCDAAAAMKQSKNREERDQHLAEAEAHFKVATEIFTEAKAVWADIQKRDEAVRAIGPAIQKAAAAEADLERRLTNAQQLLASAEADFSGAESAGGVVDGHLAVLQGLKAQGAGLVDEGERRLKRANLTDEQAKSFRDEMGALLGRIVVAEERVANCSREIRAALDASQDSRAKAREALEALRAEWAAFRQNSPGGDAGLDDVLKNLDATVAVADIFWESIQDLYAKAKHCRSAAGRLDSAPLKIPVPDLTNPPKTLPEAKALLTQAGFTPAIAGGDPAPSKDLEFRVQSQNPPPGALLEIGKPVTAVIHSQHAPMVRVPDVTGQDAKSAKAAIGRAGLVPSLTGGDPAPEEKLAFRVQSQQPSPGNQVAAGSPVTVRIFSEMAAEMPAIPTIVGLDAKTAKQRLGEAGFSVNFSGGDPAPSKKQAFTVAAQSPAAGTKVKKGSAVTAVIFGDFSEMKVAAKPDKPTMPEPPTRPQPSGPRANEFFVVFHNCFPANLKEIAAGARLPKLDERNNLKKSGLTVEELTAEMMAEAFTNAQFKDNLPPALKKVDPNSIQYSYADDSLFLFHFKGRATQTFQPEAFAKGSRWAAPAKLKIDLEGKKLGAEGALLYVSAGAFLTWADLQKTYPGAKADTSDSGALKVLLGGSKSEMPSLEIAGADGKFRFAVKDHTGSVEFVGGPPSPGWPEAMKSANAGLFAEMGAGFCGAENAYHDGGKNAVENLALFRRFRDEVLAEAEGGEEWIRFYYDEFSPWASSLMQRRPETRAFFRAGFDLLAAGMEAPPKTAHAHDDPTR